MPLFRMIFLVALVFFGGVALFLGGVVMLTSWQNGAITLSYTQEGRTIVETISRTADSGRFWQMYSWMGIAPAVFGVAALAFGLRAIRR